MSTRMPEKRWLREGYEQPEWIREGYAPEFRKTWKSETRPNCWYCKRPIARLALVLVKREHSVPFHVGCFKKQNKYEQQTVDAIGKWHAIYRQVEQAGSRGISLAELVAYCRISRSLIRKYVVSMVEVDKFLVKRGVRNGRLVELYFMPPENKR
jgi:hypothetical protein